MNKMAIAGIVVAALMFSALGAVIMAQENTVETMSQEEIEEFKLTDGNQVNPDGQYLLTEEQLITMRETAQELRDAHATRTEIRETVQAMAQDYVYDNLVSYGLAEEEIIEIQAKMTEIMDKMLEVRETAYELRGQDMNRQDIREEIQPLIEEAQELRGELKDILDQYDIIPPEIGHPGMGQGHGHGRGQGGRPGRFGGGFGRPDGAGGSCGGPRP